MHLLVLDFETFWSQTHSLSKMSPIEYVMHPETEIISCSAQVNDSEPVTVFGEDEVRRMLVDMDVEHALAVAHNMAMFDSMVLAWRLKLNPRMWGCTLSMARPVHGRSIGLSLDVLDRHYGGAGKDSRALVQTKGRHLRDFTPQEIEDMRLYNADDTRKCRRLFGHLRPLTSNREMWTIDSNIRMLVEDQFVLDTPLLQAALAREQAKKRKTLLTLAEHLGIDTSEGEDFVAQQVKDELMSAPKFAKMLGELGVPVPTKKSPTNPAKEIPALAKGDAEFTVLLDSDNEVVAAAAAARLEMKSTLLESRLQAFLATGAARAGRLPIPAKYYGAHTGRDSGDLYNALNLPRIGRDKDDKIIPKLTNALRLSIRAPKGKVIIVADCSGIEMRINHTLWRVPYSTAMWEQDREADIYKTTAAKYYGLDEAQIAKPQRQFGKVMQLACGYQCGPPKFKEFAWTQFKLELDDATAADGVYGWRRLHPEIADPNHGGWAKCQQALEYILAGREWAVDPWGLVHTCAEGLRLPDGRLIRYDHLRQSVNDKTGYVEWKYGHGRHTNFIYGGKMDENIVQALGRIVLMDNVFEFWKRTGLRTQLRVYDEAVYVVDEGVAADLLQELLSIMRTPPAWWPQLMVWSEGDMAQSYGLAK